jgi:hypothetical protein
MVDEVGGNPQNPRAGRWRKSLGRTGSRDSIGEVEEDYRLMCLLHREAWGPNRSRYRERRYTSMHLPHAHHPPGSDKVWYIGETCVDRASKYFKVMFNSYYYSITNCFVRKRKHLSLYSVHDFFLL